MRILLIALVSFLCLPSPASARTAFPYYGDRGDAGAVDECLPGSYLIGFVGLVGWWTAQISVVCGQLMPDNSISGSKTIASRGGSAGTFKSVLCGKNEVITYINASRTDNYEIAWVDFICTNLQTLSSHEMQFGGDHPAKGGTPPHENKCPAGELGTGMTIRYGKYVNGLGLICNTYTKPVPPPPPPPVVSTPAPASPPVTPTPAPPTPAPSFVNVLKDGDVYTTPCGADSSKKTGAVLRAGTSNVKLVLNKNPWFQLQWPSGSGCVYSGPGYPKALAF